MPQVSDSLGLLPYLCVTLSGVLWTGLSESQNVLLALEGSFVTDN